MHTHKNAYTQVDRLSQKYSLTYTKTISVIFHIQTD